MLGTVRHGNDQVGFSYLVVKPSQATPAALPPRPAEILSRAEIARRRGSGVAVGAPIPVLLGAEPLEVHPADMVPLAAPDTAEVVEMHVADVTPVPKNKGGRPRKNQ